MKKLTILLLIVIIMAPTVSAQDGPRRADFIGLPYVEDGHERQVVDVFLPTTGGPPFPTLVMFHGGGFSGGDRAQYRRLGLHFADQGYLVITPEYRLQPPAVYPEQLHDAFCAMGWLYAHAEEYQIDTNRIVTWGDSAGGYFAAMIGVADPPEEWVEDCSYDMPEGSLVQGVISFYGVLNFTNTAWDSFSQAHFTEYFGFSQTDDPDLWSVASPITWIDADDPPFLLIHHLEDSVVPVAESMEFAAALEAVEVDATLHIIDDTTTTPYHGFITDNRPTSQRVAFSLEAVGIFLDMIDLRTPIKN